jgi:hypothetical protein
VPSEPIAPFADDLASIFAYSIALLGKAATDRRSPMHTPSLATLGLDGRPRNRIVVLRHYDVPSLSLRFHTDIRSDKFEELGHDARVSMLFYDPAEKIQLRVEGTAERHVEGSVAEEAWLSSQAMSRHCYATNPSPGSEIGVGDGFTLPKGRALTDEGRVNFSAIRVTFNRLEWLWLGSAGHRRALFSWTKAHSPPAMRWLVP